MIAIKKSLINETGIAPCISYDKRQYILNSDDKTYVAEIKKSNKKAFEILFNKYYPQLSLFAEGILFDSQAAQDIVQTLFIKLWEDSRQIKINSSVKAYLFTSVRNRCFNRIKSLKVQDKNNFLYFEGLLNSSDLTELEDNSRCDLIAKALNSLPAKMSEIFKMKYFDNRKIKNIATKLNISENTVKTQLLRAKKKLKENLCNYLK